MRIPFGNETVTLIRRLENIIDGKTHVYYERQVLHSCSWRRSTMRSIGDAETVYSAEIICRIPAGQCVPGMGDCLFLGDLQLDITSSRELAQALEAHSRGKAFRIASVVDNARSGLPLPHYAARGSEIA